MLSISPPSCISAIIVQHYQMHYTSSCEARKLFQCHQSNYLEVGKMEVTAIGGGFSIPEEWRVDDASDLIDILAEQLRKGETAVRKC